MLTLHKAAQMLLPTSRAVSLLLAGDPEVRLVAMELAASIVMAQGTILWIEAANRFELFAFTEGAKRWGNNPQPFLKQIHVARAFTLYQLGTLCTDGLQAALRQHPGALTVLSDPLALCWDAEVPLPEARRVVRTIAAGMTRLGQRGHRIVLTCPEPPEAFRSRSGLVELLRPAAAHMITVRAVEPGVIRLDGVPESTGPLTALA